MNIKDLLNEQLLFEEMSNLRKQHTGLPMVIWIQPKTRNEQHWARIKVAKQYGDKVSSDLFTITISDNPEVIGETGNIKNQDIELTKEFVIKNKKILLSVWNDEITPVEAVSLFTKV